MHYYNIRHSSPYGADHTQKLIAMHILYIKCMAQLALCCPRARPYTPTLCDIKNHHRDYGKILSSLYLS